MFNFIKNIIIYLSEKFSYFPNNKKNNEERLQKEIEQFNAINNIIILYDLDLQNQKTEFLYKGIHC